MEERIHEFDIAKGIGMFWVIWAHIAHVELIREYVWPFHMPLFFFISGLLFNHRLSFWKFIGKRVRSLLIPYAVFYMVTFVYWVLVERHFRGGQYSVGYELAGLVYGTYEGGHLFFNGVLWFLPCLFATEALFFPISRLERPIGVFGGVLLSFTVGQLLLALHVFWLPFGLHTAFNAVLFYGMGFLLKGFLSQMKDLPNIQKFLFLLACLGFQVLFLGRYVSNVKVCTLPYAAIAFAGILFYMMLSVCIQRNAVLEFLGRNTLVLLCIHAPLCRASLYGASIIWGVPVELIRCSFLSSLAMTLLAIFAMVPFILIWKKAAKL